MSFIEIFLCNPCTFDAEFLKIIFFKISRRSSVMTEYRTLPSLFASLFLDSYRFTFDIYKYSNDGKIASFDLIDFVFYTHEP